MKNIPPGMEIMTVGPYSPSRPAGLYHMMLKHIAPYGIRGVIWYQGESDEIHADIYKEVLSNLIDCWRGLWEEELPFLCVQLAPFEAWLAMTGERFPQIRQAQKEVASVKNAVYLVSISDSGMQYDIHPKKKQPIGQRLAASAKGHVYGKDILCDAPECEEISWKGDSLLLMYRHAEGGLRLVGGTIHAMEIWGTTGDIREQIPINPQDIRITGNTILIENMRKEEYSEYEIQFAATGYYKVNLYNQTGIPAIPFVARIRDCNSMEGAEII